MKPKYDNEADIPEALREFYKLENGAWHVQMTGMVPAERLNEFRTNNVELTNRLKAFEPLEGKVDEAVAALGIVSNLDAKKLVDAGEVEKVIAQRLEATNAAHATEIAKLKGEVETASSSLAKFKVDAALTKYGTEHGIRSTALDDLKARGSAVFSLGDDGEIVAKDASGNILFDSAAGAPVTVESWTKSLIKQAPHLFNDSTGTGGEGAPTGGSPQYAALKAANPFKAGPSWNLTKQGQLLKDPQTAALAKRLASEAGVAVPEAVTDLRNRN